jgi:hypothetical protein
MNLAKVLFYEDKCACDMCDKPDKKVAIIDTLGGNILCICLDCLRQIADEKYFIEE